MVLDNLSAHRNRDVCAAVEATRCHLRYLPAYSPDVNPIDLAFAKLKTHLCSVVVSTSAPLLAAIGVGMGQAISADSTGYCQHCSFNLPQSPTQPS